MIHVYGLNEKNTRLKTAHLPPANLRQHRLDQFPNVFQDKVLGQRSVDPFHPLWFGGGHGFKAARDLFEKALVGLFNTCLLYTSRCV